MEKFAALDLSKEASCAVLGSESEKRLGGSDLVDDGVFLDTARDLGNALEVSLKQDVVMKKVVFKNQGLKLTENLLEEMVTVRTENLEVQSANDNLLEDASRSFVKEVFKGKFDKLTKKKKRRKIALATKSNRKQSRLCAKSIKKKQKTRRLNSY